MSLPDVTGSRAVLIGVGDYLALAKLPTVPAGVAALRDALTDPRVWGLRAKNCATVTGPAEMREVMRPVREAAAAATDTLLIYYAGHGLVGASHEFLLALRDSSPGEPETALPYGYLRQAVVASPAVRKIVILDCCFSGRAMVGGMSAGDDLADSTPIEGTYLLTSSAETQRSLAPVGEPYTAFTGELLRALTEGVPGKGELLAMEDLFERVRHELRAKSRPEPQRRNGNDGGRIHIALNRAHGGGDGEEARLRRRAAKGDADAMNRLGLLLEERGDLAGAEARYRESIGAGGDNAATAMYNLADLLEKRRRFSEAEVWYRRSADLGDTDAMYGLADLLEDRDDIAQAETWLRKAADLGDTDAMARLADLLRRRDEQADAEALYLRVIEDRGDEDPGAMAGLGHLLEKRGDLAGAEAWFRRSAGLGYIYGIMGLADLLEARGETAEAESWCLRAATGGDTEAMGGLAELLERRGDLAGAESWYRRAAAGDDTGAMNNLGLLLENAGDLAEAEEWYRRAIDAGADDVEVATTMDNLGMLLEDRGDLAGAEHWYRRAAAAGETDAMYHLGDLLEKRADLTGAEDWYKRAAAKGHAQARESLDALPKRG
ncbi:hypothetical protein Afil01_54690 [Actinorhabdospora filicis]|uniref:Peptidase C14 caspase domain-containing protein n=1 Tax=Actinorhabdospora filicis TaxID=1785913 RepID=A0A9W6W5R1_9ACTN|nr:tetratricopeptide repeat protein [Actinorhabdospora filicis]GLZ80662.1 hypothetical protein Afil01_54690 [Actinorhabdospora filicis]